MASGRGSEGIGGARDEGGLGPATVSGGRIMVGRDRELQELRGLLDATIAGRGSLAILSGEAGIGKTYLSDGVAREARESGLGVHWGRGWEGGGAPSYWPWIQILRSVLGNTEHLPSWLDDRSRSYFALILPELQDGAASPSPGDSAQDRFQLFDSIVRYLRREAEERPMLLVLDDLQLFDTPSLQLLEFLARELRSAAIFALASHREPDPEPEAARSDILGRLSREASTLYLQGLEPADVGALIEAQATESPSEDLIARLHDVTEGNPLFVSELVRLLLVGGRIDERVLSRRSIAIPGGLRRAIRQRLADADSELTRLLWGASVLGQRFDSGVLAAVLDVPSDEVGRLLQRASTARVVARSAETPSGWTFAHVLVRDVLYEDIPGDERMQLHLRAGEALEQHVGREEEALDPLAYHFGEAAQVGGKDRALDYARRAADRAMRIFAYADAAGRYQQALSLLDLGGPSDGLQRGRLLLGLGNALNRAGEVERARAIFLSAASVARTSSDAGLFAEAALGYGRETMTTGVVDERVVELLEEALDLVGGSDLPTRLTLLKRLSDELLYSDDERRRTELSSEAVEIARLLDEPAALARALSAQAMAVAGPDNVEQRASAGLEIVALGQRAKTREIVIDGHLVRIGALLEAGDVAAADAELARYARLGEELRQPSHAWFALVMRSGRAIADGRFDEAERLMDDAWALGEGLRGEEAHQYHVVQRFALLWEARRAQVREVEADVRRIAEEYPALPAFRAMWLALQAAMGHESLVRGALAELRRRELGSIQRNLGWLAAMAFLAESALAAGEADAADELYGLLAPYDDHNVVFDWSVASFGSAARYLGLLAETLGRHDDAVSHLERGLEQNLRMGALPQAARSQLDLARLLATRDRAGDRERARELATQAREAFADLGMEHEATLADHRLVELGGVPLSAAPVGESAPAVFRKEGEYWAIVYDTDTFRLKDAKGLAYLATLLRDPGREFHALDLFTGPSGGGPSARGKDPDLEGSFGETAGPRLDPEAKAAYKRRLADLDEDLEEAEANNDPERAAKARSEREFLIRELAGAVGLGGRDRPTGSAAERARINVTKAIKTAVGRIEAHSPSLGQHLHRTIRTGTFCSYQPDPRSLVTWRS